MTINIQSLSDSVLHTSLLNKRVDSIIQLLLDLTDQDPNYVNMKLGLCDLDIDLWPNNMVFALFLSKLFLRHETWLANVLSRDRGQILYCEKKY